MRAYQNAAFRVDGLKPQGHMADPMAYYMNVPTYATLGGGRVETEQSLDAAVILFFLDRRILFPFPKPQSQPVTPTRDDPILISTEV